MTLSVSYRVGRQSHLMDGGAPVIGHPVRARGARIALHLLLVLARNGARLGLEALYIGGGHGRAMLVERC